MLAFAADLFTVSRLVAAAMLIWLGTLGPGSLQTAILVGVLAWSSDMLDGWLARHARTPTRLAPYDFWFDSCLSAASLAYLVLAGFLPVVPTLVASFLALGAGLAFRQKAIQVLSIRLVDLTVAVVIFTHAPEIGWLVAAWLGAMAYVYRRRLADRVPRWFGELAQILGLRRGL